MNRTDGVAHLLSCLRVRSRARSRVRAAKRVERTGRAVELIVRRAGTAVSAGTARWRSWQTAFEPCVAKGRVGRHSSGRIPFEASADKVQKVRVIAAFEGGLKFAGTRGPARFSPTTSAPVQNGSVVRQCCDRAVTWVT